jgi:hypothetical protein
MSTSDLDVIAQDVSLEVQQFLDETADVLVVTEENAEQVAEQLVVFARIKRRAEEKRQELKAPILEAGRGIDAFFKALIKPADDAHARLKRANNEYETRKAREQAERDRAERERLERQQREQEEQRAKLAEAAGVPVEAMPVLDIGSAVVVPEPERARHVAGGSVSSRRKVVVTVAEPLSPRIPRGLMVPDERAIRAFCERLLDEFGDDDGARRVEAIFGTAVTVEIEMTTVVNTRGR